MESAIQRCLSCRVLTVPRLDYVAHDAFVDARWIDSGAGDRFAYDDGTQIRRFELFQSSEEFSGGRPDRRDDDAVFHISFAIPGLLVRYGVRAGGWNLLRGPGHNRPDLVISEYLPHLAEHAVTRPLNLANPSLVDGANGQDPVGQLDRGGASERLTDGKLPGKVRPFFRRWLSPHNLRQNSGRETLQWNHRQSPAGNHRTNDHRETTSLGRSVVPGEDKER
jgi:hypothetical protein